MIKRLIMTVFIILLSAPVIAQELYGSFSLRPAKQIPNPFDWEIRLGARSNSGNLMYLRERQNGRFWYGYEIQRRWQQKNILLDGKLLRQTEKNLSSQSLSLLGTKGVFGLGFSGSWIYWEAGRLLATARLIENTGRFTYSVEYSKNFLDRTILLGEVRYRKPVTKKTGIAITGNYRNIQTITKTYQLKAELSYLLR